MVTDLEGVVTPPRASQAAYLMEKDPLPREESVEVHKRAQAMVLGLSM